MRLGLLVLLWIGCAHDVRARFPASAAEPTGTLVLLLSRPASNVTLAIDGQLVVEDARTRRVTIERVPSGTRELAIAANGGDKQLRAWVDADRTTTIPLGVPEPPMAFWKGVLGSLISIVAYAMLR